VVLVLLETHKLPVGIPLQLLSSFSFTDWNGKRGLEKQYQR